MDNICHTLVGAALAEAGLKQRTRLGAATLIIGANLPDIDVLAVPLGLGLTFRRGWTHGVLALLVLPFILAGIMLWWDRRRRRKGDIAERARGRELLLLAALSILTHPTLDFLNTYGVRWLMPFSARWFYGDALFIVDPWMWIVLLGGVVLARRGARGSGMARVALGIAVGYVVAMLGVSAITRARFVGSLRAQVGVVPRIMVAPVPVNPVRREILFDAGDRYRVGTVSVFAVPAELTVEREIAKGEADPAVAAAVERPEVRRFLAWSRFPFFEVTRDASGVTVRVADARYAIPGGDSWAAMTVRLPRIIAVPRR